MAKPTKPYTSPSHLGLIFSWAIVFPLMFLQWYRFGVMPLVSDDLDPSWSWVTARAFEQGLRWGHDIVFTYGPLGFLHPQSIVWPPTAETFRHAQIVIALLEALIATTLFTLVDNSRRILMIAVVCVCAIGGSADVIWFVVPVFSLLAIVYLGAQPHARTTLFALVAASTLYAGIIIGIKVSSIPSVTLWWLCASGVLAFRREHAAALFCFVGVPIATIAIWLAAGQRIGDLLPHFGYALELSAGYGGVMGVFPRWQVDLAGVAVAGVSALLVLHAMWRNRRDVALVIAVGYIGATLFLAWRTGYTRADLHVIIFLFCAAILLPQLPRVSDGVLRPVGLGAVLVAVVSCSLFVHAWNTEARIPPAAVLRIAPLIVLDNWGDLRDANRRHAMIDAATAEARKSYALPEIRAEVGTSTVDLIGQQQGVIALNDLNYTPRPVFQGYAAYSPRLARLNEAFLAGERAPDYVMLPFSPIDGHPATSEDPLSYPTLLRRYVPVLVESKYLLLKRTVPPVEPIAIAAPESGARAMLGDWVDVPQDGRPTMLSFAAELNLAGKAAAFLVREPMWFMEVARDDGSTLKFRVTRNAGKTGFLLSPLVNSLDDWVFLFARESMPRVTRFRLLPQSDRLSRLAKPEYHYAFTPLDTSRWVPPVAADSRIFTSLYPGFNRRPDRREGTISLIAEDGKAALFTHSPARLSFDLPAGSYVVDGEAGIRKAALSTPDCAVADGVAVDLQVAGGVPLRLARINPFADKAAANPVHFRSDVITLATGGTVDYRVEFGDVGSNPACDWAYVRDLKILPSASVEAKP